MSRSSLATLAFALPLAVLSACGDDDLAQGTPEPTEAGADQTPDASVQDDGAVSADALPAYVVPGEESMAAIAIERATGQFYVDSADSGKMYRGLAGANAETTLELFADFTEAGIGRGGHLALSPDGARMVVASSFGSAAAVHFVDVAQRTKTKTIVLPAADAGFPTTIQDVTFSADGTRVYATSSFENVIYVVDPATEVVSSFPLSSEFPFISNANQGFINATGLALSNDGAYLLVVHIIDKHVYRVALDPARLGEARQIDTTPYNVSGNGLWLGADGEAIEVAGDELRVFRFQMNADYTRGEYRTKYQGDFLEPGLTYAVAHEDRILVLNGNGVALSAGPGVGGGGVPEGGLPAGGDAGFPPPGGDAGTKKLPIKILQLRK